MPMGNAEHFSNVYMASVRRKTAHAQTSHAHNSVRVYYVELQRTDGGGQLAELWPQVGDSTSKILNPLEAIFLSAMASHRWHTKR